MRRVALAALCSLFPALLAAQAPAGRLEGRVSGAPRAVHGTRVEVTRVQPEPVETFVVPTDDRGQYRFDSLPPGDYAVHVSSPLLDSLALSLPDRSVTIAAGREARADVALPSGAAMRDAVCPGLALDKGQGAVTGHAIDADTEQPLVDAMVVVSWNELTVDRATLKATTEERLATAPTGARGEFRLCGVPTGTALSLQLQRGDAASAEVKLAVLDDQGVVVRDLSLSAGAAPPIATADAIDRASSRAALDTATSAVLGGTAALAGTVRGVGGRPLANTELRIVGAGSIAVSDTTGRFSLGALPAGTHMLVARRIGYEALETPVELRAGRVVQRDVQLTRVVSLDSIRVVALRARYPQFDFNRRANPFGIYLGPEELARRTASQTSDFLAGVRGLLVSGHGRDARARTTRGAASLGCDGMRILLDGRDQGLQLDDIPASNVGAIEIHTQGALAPSEYSIRGACGVIAVWTKRFGDAPRHNAGEEPSARPGAPPQ